MLQTDGTVHRPVVPARLPHRLHPQAAVMERRNLPKQTRNLKRYIVYNIAHTRHVCGLLAFSQLVRIGGGMGDYVNAILCILITSHQYQSAVRVRLK